MNENERNSPRQRRPKPSIPDEGIAAFDKSEPKSEAATEAFDTERAARPAPPHRHDADRDGPRLWALPDAELGWWIVRENDGGGAVDLTDGIPSIFVPALSTEVKTAAAERCREFVAGRLRDRWQEDLFQLIKRLMVGGIFTLAGLIALRFVEYFDVPLLLGALGYSAYAAIRYGGRLLKSLQAANRPFAQFVGEPFVVSALAERIAAALDYRRALAPEKRGESPDAELLDANAYRKLIRDGVIAREELCALGAAVQSRLNVTAGAPRKISDLARQEGLDPESAALYRDLALASAEIMFDSEFK